MRFIIYLYSDLWQIDECYTNLTRDINKISSRKDARCLFNTIIYILWVIFLSEQCIYVWCSFWNDKFILLRRLRRPRVCYSRLLATWSPLLLLASLFFFFSFSLFHFWLSIHGHVYIYTSVYPGWSVITRARVCSRKQRRKIALISLVHIYIHSQPSIYDIHEKKKTYTVCAECERICRLLWCTSGSLVMFFSFFYFSILFYLFFFSLFIVLFVLLYPYASPRHFCLWIVTQRMVFTHFHSGIYSCIRSFDSSLSYMNFYPRSRNNCY